MENTTIKKSDVYERVTNKIIAALEHGIRPWVQPWSAVNTEGRITRPLRYNGTPYKGINVLLLWGESVAKGFEANVWMTYKQAKSIGAQVKKGEKGSLVVYANSITKEKVEVEVEEEEESEEEKRKKIYFLKGYTVFNAQQIEGLPEHFYAKPAEPIPLQNRIANADDLISKSKAKIRHGGNQAFYSSMDDLIQLPPFEAFKDPESYYGTALHEIVHSTKHPSRLNRNLGRKRFGDEGYAREELVAELGAAFLCADLGIAPEVRDDHAEYVGHWLKVLKDDKRAIFQAATHAQKAADFLNNLRQEEIQKVD